MSLLTEVWNEMYGEAYRDYVVKPKLRAHNLLHYYLNTGKVKRLPCEIAGCKETKTEGHHPDYNEPLTVLWLCKKHHTEVHKHIAPVYSYVII
jgi:hypothetical protein